MIYSVQYMRAIAALMVVISHSSFKAEQYSTNPLSWFNIGAAGVDLFFIISGYIMCHTVDKKQVKVSSFIKARIFRIVPLYWTLTTLALLIYFLYPEKINSSGGNTNLLASYTLFPTEDKFLIKNGWTLSYEFYFYFLFSFSLALKASYKYLIPVGIIATLVFLGAWVGNINHQLGFITSQFLLEFAFGILVFYFTKRTKIDIKYGFVLIILSFLLFVLVNNSNTNSPRVLMYGVPTFIFFFGMVVIEPIFKKHNTNFLFKTLKAIGDSSYSLYLFHAFSLVIFSIILNRLGLNQYGSTFVTLLVISSVITGHLCYLFLEKPLAQLTKKYNKKRTAQSVNLSPNKQ